MTEHREFPECEGVEYFFADDGRLVAMVVRADFEGFELFPPYIDTEEEKAFMQKAYDVDLEREKYTKAHVTPAEFPLQITILNRDPGSTVKPHYHLVYEQPKGETRHQIMWTQRGKIRIGVYTRENQHLGDAVLERGDLILMTEGHQVEFLEPDTRVLEVKQGPIPEDMSDEMVVLQNDPG